MASDRREAIKIESGQGAKRYLTAEFLKASSDLRKAYARLFSQTLAHPIPPHADSPNRLASRAAVFRIPDFSQKTFKTLLTLT